MSRRRPAHRLAWVLAALAALVCACSATITLPAVDADAAADAAGAETTSDTVAGDDAPADVHQQPAPQGWVPASVTDLYGAWENQDEETVRRYEFRFLDNGYQDLFNITPAYRLYKGNKGQVLEIIERGEFKLANGPQLVTTSQWSIDISTLGKTKKTPFVPIVTPFAFGLEVLPGVAREFIRVETFPRFP